MDNQPAGFTFIWHIELILMSWADFNAVIVAAVLLSAAQQLWFLPKGSLKVIGNRGEGLFFNLFGDSTWQPSWLLIILPSSVVSSSHHLSSSQASSSPSSSSSSSSSSLSLRCVVTGQQSVAARSHSLIKLGTGKRFTRTLPTHTHSSCYRAVPAPVGWQSQTSYCSKTGLW